MSKKKTRRMTNRRKINHQRESQERGSASTQSPKVEQRTFLQAECMVYFSRGLKKNKQMHDEKSMPLCFDGSHGASVRYAVKDKIEQCVGHAR